MSEHEASRPGVLEGFSRVLREFLRTPRWQKTIRIFLRDLDPPGAKELVSALWEEDPELFLSLLAALPFFANAGIEALQATATHLVKMPPELAQQFTSQLQHDIDAEKLGETLALCMLFIQRLEARQNETEPSFAQRLAAGFAKGMEASETNVIAALPAMVDNLADELVDFAQKQPALATSVVKAVRRFTAVVDEQAKGAGGNGNTE